MNRKLWLTALGILLIVFCIAMYLRNTANILGYYVYREYLPPNLERVCNVYVFKEQDGLYAQISLDGMQFDKRIKTSYTTKVWTHGNEMKFEFWGHYSFLPGTSVSGLGTADHIKGDVMMTLKKRGNKFMVEWGEEKPLLDQHDEPGQYFIKDSHCAKMTAVQNDDMKK